MLDMTDRTPAQGRDSFHCPNCGVLTEQTWCRVDGVTDSDGTVSLDGFSASMCRLCWDPALWKGDSMIFPLERQGVAPHEDMPDDVKAIYDEARSVAALSKKSAAGLLRLALQMLIDDLEPGKGTIDTKIGKLVARGLAPQVQKMMDVLRIVGNESVHPGTMDLDADPDLLASLFGLTNLIVEQIIAQPKHIESLYGKLPEGKREAIEKRDGAGIVQIADRT